MSCDKIQLLLSKYADNEATQPEREAVRAHITTCAQCARKLAEFEHVPAIFASSTTLPPEPQLRVGVFREINLMKEEERRKQREVQEKHPWYLPVPALRTNGRSRFAWLWTIFRPASVGMLAVLTFFGLMLYTNRQTPPSQVFTPTPRVAAVMNLRPMPTAPAPVVSIGGVMPVNGSPEPDAADNTKAIPATFLPRTALPDTASNATMLPTAMREGLLLSDPTPILENLDSTGGPTHLVRDPAYGYSAYYPSNWWTQTDGSVRYFRPWATNGSDSLPYWIELHVDPNTESYTATTYNTTYLEGEGDLIPGSSNADMRLSHSYSDTENSYHDLYSFDSLNIYTLHMIVPWSEQLSTYETRWYEAETILSGMSARNDYTRRSSSQETISDEGVMLFLNGSALYKVNLNGQAHTVTTGGFNVRQFALSPDMRNVAFTSAQKSIDLWGRQLYLADLENDNSDTLSPLWPNATEIHDITWYSDRVLLAIAKTTNGSGIYRISLPQNGIPFDPSTMVQLITPLEGDMATAKGLSVSPDRQLITFLAPIGESVGTNVYRIRPDGSDLQVLISHSMPISPSDSENGNLRILEPEKQAIKSYVWVDGHLENGVYTFNLLYTCGNSLSPSFYQGGFIYSAPSENRYSLLGNRLLAGLGVSDPTKLHVVHMAYSTSGKLAITGYYLDYQERADKLAGLWTADVVDGQVVNMHAQPIPPAPDGITDLQWSPDNGSLIYRETIPQDPISLSSRYDGRSPFMIVKQELDTGTRTILYGDAQR